MAAANGNTHDSTRVITEFALGRIVLTPGALAALGDRAAAAPFLRRHQDNDWGELSEFDRQANDEAVLEGDRILSKYRTAGGAFIYIITEHDRSSTTILLPEEY